jgi:hypothetical protein
VKISERRSTLLGVNAPASHVVAIMHQAPPQQPTGFDRIKAAIDRVQQAAKQ